MGKKNKGNRRDDDDFGDVLAGPDHSTGYVSAKAAAKKEAEEAKKGGRGGPSTAADLSDSGDEGDRQQSKKKKNRRNKKGGQQQEDDFADGSEVIGAKDQRDEDGNNIQNQLDDHFEGVGKKNTRKKKAKESAYGQGAGGDLATAFDEGADSDEVYARKGGKNKKDNKKHQGKKKNKKHESDEEQEQEEEKVETAQPEGSKDAVQEGGLPLEVIYCKKCGLPPEYCSFGQKDVSACKEWLRSAHPVLFVEVYGEEAGATTEEAKASAEPTKEGEAPSKDAAEAKPQKKKVRFGKDPDKEGLIVVNKLKRGGKKVICQLTGFEYYTKDLKSLASKFGKKFSCGSAVAQDDIYGECISIQGDVEDKLLDILESDKDMKDLNIPENKIIFEDKGQKKGRKRGPK